MSFSYLTKIPSSEEIINEMPLSENLKKAKKARDSEIRDIFTQKDKRFILIIGPCSADNEKAVLEYVNRLKLIQDKTKDKLLLIPRIYTNKPRTTGEGYKGMAHQPDPNQDPDIVKGLRSIRKMHLRIIEETGLTAADEMLYPENYPYLEDLLGYVAVGARSVENQLHRLTASGLSIPVGMKNPTSGDLGVMLNSIKAAQVPHIFTYNGWEVKTEGNDLAHSILRGAFSPHGENIPNYHYESTVDLMTLYLDRNLENPSIIIDCNHANSGKKFNEQPRIAFEVLRNRQHSDILKNAIKGLMIESYLVEGCQKVGDGVYGKSITDPCLSWDTSEQLILKIAELV